MDSSSDTAKLISVTDKLNAPQKLTPFERTRLEEKLKREREDDELKRALNEYEDIFDDSKTSEARGHDDGEDRGAHGVKRSRFDEHTGTSSVLAPSSKRKRDDWAEVEQGSRVYDNRDSDRRRSRRSLSPMGYEQDDYGSSRPSKKHSPERSVRKPTMLLQLLPQTVTEEDIRQVMPASLKVEEVRLFKPTNPRDAERYLSAHVSCSSSTPTSELDKAVSQVQDKYLGCGCYAKASRYVASSGKLGNIDTSVLEVNVKQPFGAAPRIIQEPIQPSHRDAPHSLSRMPPPSSFDQGGTAASRPVTGPLTVTVSPPTDLRLLKIIHETAERVIQHGQDFEALLMAQPGVQRDEKWAWLFESTSKASAYYRWLIWDGLCGDEATHPDDLYVFDSGPVWSVPAATSKYSTVLSLEDICQDDDYISSDDDDSDDEPAPNDRPARRGGPMLNIDEVGVDAQSHYLNPSRRAKLTYLLARMPDSIAMLRRGDIARISHFVINNANNGAEEIIDMLVSNLEHPFRDAVKYDDEEQNLDAATRTSNDEQGGEDKLDCSGLQLIALYIISDVLLASSTAGVSNAWKYRNLFEASLLSRQVFERLGRLEKVNGWGRMKAEQWKRKILIVLDLWTERSVFTTDSLRQMRSDLMETPTGNERAEKTAESKAKWITTAPSAPAPSKEAAEADIKAEVARRAAAMQANIAAIKAKASSATENAGEEAPAAPAPLEKQSSGGFSFNLGGSTSTPSAPKPTMSIGFSLNPAPAKPSSSSKSSGGVFGDDDSD